MRNWPDIALVIVTLALAACGALYEYGQLAERVSAVESTVSDHEALLHRIDERVTRILCKVDPSDCLRGQ